jgi:dipeptidyl aminopeptidase/acylaminoacyl peptidase
MLAMFITVVSSCSSVSQPKIEPTALPSTPNGFYWRVAWFDSKHIALLYNQSTDEHLWEAQIYLYFVKSQEWHFLKFAKPKECYNTTPSFITRLPENNLGVMYQCSVNISGDSFESKGLVYILRSDEEVPEIWREFKDMLEPKDFSLSPDMKQIVLENNGGLGGDAFIANKTGEHQRILTDFFKVSSPHWSPDGASIAFAGIKEEATPSFLDPEGFFANWGLYLMDSDQSDVHSILSNVINPYFLKWSPNGRFLAFSGRYDGQDGVFALEINTSKVTKIVSTLSYYDWSPDGKQMVIVEPTKRDGNKVLETRPVIVDLPETLQDPPK